MKIFLFALVVLSLTAFGEDRDKDVIPLKGPGGTSKSSEKAESELLAAPKTKTTTKTSPKGSDPTAGMPGVPVSKPYIASLESFGSSRINESGLRKFLGGDLDTWLQKGLAGDPTSKDWEEKLRDKVKAKFGFPFAEWSVIQYFDPGDFAIHVTLDVIEPAEIKKRMPFSPAPTGEFKDPDNLVKAWMDYEDTALDLVERGQLEPGAIQCPALHCPFGHKHPKLKKYEKQFVEGARKNEVPLAEIALKDRRPEFRGSAIYLLAYLKDGKKVVSYLMDRTKDVDDLVRNNALRVLGDIAEFHPEYVIPLKPITDALYYPRVSDRSKAVYVLFQMSANSQQVRDETLKTAVPDLLRLMESKQPDHRELSHMILKKISGKEFAVTDGRSWANWYAKVAGDRGISKK